MASERTQIGIDIDAVDKASDKIADVADEAKKLEKIDPTVDVDADDKATAKLRDVADEADKVDKKDPRLEITADIDAAKADLAELKRSTDELGAGADGAGDHVSGLTEDTGKAKDAMHGFVGEAITELPGVGQALGPASEAVGQITEGLLAGEIAMGGLVTAAIPIAGIVIAMQAITSQIERQKRIDAFNEQQVKTYTDALAGAADEAGALADNLQKARKVEFVDAGGDVVDVTENLKNLKLSAQEFAGFVADDKSFDTWLANLERMRPELTPLIESIKEYGVQSLNAGQNVDRGIIAGGEDVARVMQAVEQSQTNYAKATRDAATANAVFGTTLDTKVTPALKDVKGATDRTKEGFDELRGAINFEQDADQLKEDLLGALNGVAQFGVEPTRAQIQQLKLDIIDVGETSGKTKVEIDTELRRLDQGDYLTVLADVEAWSKYNPILLATALATPVVKGKNPIIGNPRPDGGTTSVTVNMPAGSRGVDVVRQLSGHARRAGRFYGAPVVTHARR